MLYCLKLPPKSCVGGSSGGWLGYDAGDDGVAVYGADDDSGAGTWAFALQIAGVPGYHSSWQHAGPGGFDCTWCKD